MLYKTLLENINNNNYGEFDELSKTNLINLLTSEKGVYIFWSNEKPCTSTRIHTLFSNIITCEEIDSFVIKNNEPCKNTKEIEYPRSIIKNKETFNFYSGLYVVSEPNIIISDENIKTYPLPIIYFTFNKPDDMNNVITNTKNYKN